MRRSLKCKQKQKRPSQKNEPIGLPEADIEQMRDMGMSNADIVLRLFKTVNGGQSRERAIRAYSSIAEKFPELWRECSNGLVKLSAKGKGHDERRRN